MGLVGRVWTCGAREGCVDMWGSWGGWVLSSRRLPSSGPNPEGPNPVNASAGEQVLEIWPVFPNLIPQVICISYAGKMYATFTLDEALVRQLVWKPARDPPHCTPFHPRCDVCSGPRVASKYGRSRSPSCSRSCISMSFVPSPPRMVWIRMTTRRRPRRRQSKPHRPPPFLAQAKAAPLSWSEHRVGARGGRRELGSGLW